VALRFPDDADGDALRRVADDGSDMSKPMEIDFTVAVPGESAGKAIAERAGLLGYRTKVARDREDDAWTCYCTKRMLATHEGVVAAQAELQAISVPFGGHCDGWGTFGNQDVVQH
jgi:regulator of ribonuclease activity B